ncbi:MAG: hypothetical protein NC395_07370 [Prevotella sp.]|nr:hypothetical protein [Prevotella sp.]
MKKIAVVYSSKSGHTKQYADWLKEDVADVDVIPVANFSPSQTMAYKLVIFACGVYGDKLSIMDYVKKNITAMSPQKTMIMAVSWYTNDSEEAKQKLIGENYPEQFKNTVPIFVLNSGVDKKSLSAVDKMKLTAAQMSIDKKEGRSSDDINALAIIKGYSDQTSKDNLASIKQAIDNFFNPPKISKTSAATPARPAPQAPAAKPSPAPAAAQAAPAPAKPAPAPKPMDVSEMKSDADALNSLENAFKALKAPKTQEAPAPKPEPKPEPPAAAPAQPKPKPKVDPVKASVASSVKDAIAALSSGELVTNYNPAPTFEIDDSDADTYSEAVADSIMLVNQTVSAAKQEAAPQPAPEPVKPAPAPAETAAAPEPVKPAPAPAETAAAPEPVKPAPKPAETVTAPEPVKTAPAPAETAAAPSEAQPAQRKNSYMELFAKRRRNPEAVSEASAPTPNSAPAAPAETAAQPAPKTSAQPFRQPSVPTVPRADAKPSAPAAAPAAPPTLGKSSDPVIDFDFIMDDGPVPTVETPAPQPAPAVSAPAVDMDVYDFISEDDSKPAVSSRAMNAVQDLAKAKAEAEKEKLKAAAAAKQESDDSIIEKMRRDIETFAEESEQEIEVVSENYGDTSYEEDDDGLEGFTFSNDVEYDLDTEFIEPPIVAAEKTVHEKQSKTNLDIRKLQEEINASIEQNKATKEKMEQRYKKEKEEYHNPFAVQFEEDESKSKKKKKTVEVRRLADPIDPDIFFSKAGKDYDATPGEMPEIKFRNR